MKYAGPITLGAAATIAALVILFGDDEKPTVGACGGGCDGTDAKKKPTVGFAPPAAEPQSLVDEARGVLGPTERDVAAWEYDKPTMGGFYQVQRGDIFLGSGPKSITFMVLSRACEFLRSQGHRVPIELPHELGLRVDYANLIHAGRFNPTLFATWGYGPKAFVGPHGRAIPLDSYHADVRTALYAGRPLERAIPLGSPADVGTGRALRTTGLARPFLWLPLLNLDALLDGYVTTEGVAWDDDDKPTIDPPEWFMRGLPT